MDHMTNPLWLALLAGAMAVTGLSKLRTSAALEALEAFVAIS